MIDVKDLRIGNYVEYKERNVCIIGMTLEDVDSRIVIGDIGTRFLKQINPIPLTDKILEKCGFEKVKNIKGSYELNGLIIHSQYPPPHKEELFNAVTEVYYYDKRVFCFDGCKYLHKLQNLYYILTGKELEIKL